MTLPMLALLLLSSPPALCRQEVLVRALAYSRHPWICTEANTRATCHPDYVSDFHPGRWVGLPYDWGGSDLLGQFDRALAAGRAAGSHSDHGVLACSAGQDCSGFVSRCWDLAHHSTASLWKVSSDLRPEDLRPGDAFNLPGVHVVLFGGLFADGWPLFFEATGSLVQVNPWEGWAAVEGYQPIRRDGLLETCAKPTGTMDFPIEIDALPFTALGDTRRSQSQVLDFCGAAPTKHTLGPEDLYHLTLTHPARLVATVQDDASADLDLALYRGRSSLDCVARDDRLLDLPLDCGDWLLAVDTFTNAEGLGHPGRYVLEVRTEARPGPCGVQPRADLEGQPASPCQAVGPSATFCNPNTGATACLALAGLAPFCTLPCAVPGDCLPWFPDACCLEASPLVGPPGRFCTPAAACDAGPGVQPSDEASQESDALDGGSQDSAAGPEDDGYEGPKDAGEAGGKQGRLDGGGGAGGGCCLQQARVPPGPPQPWVCLLALGLLGLRLCANLLCWSRRSGGEHAKPGENGRRDSPGLGHWQGPAGLQPGVHAGRAAGQEWPARGPARPPEGPNPGPPA
jgi:hypothetical protein